MIDKTVVNTTVYPKSIFIDLLKSTNCCDVFYLSAIYNIPVVYIYTYIYIYIIYIYIIYIIYYIYI